MQKNVEKFGISDKRGRVMTSLDPFVSDEGFPEPPLCKDCQAYFHHKRWMNDPETYHQLQSDPHIHLITCQPAKKNIRRLCRGVFDSAWLLSLET